MVDKKHILILGAGISGLSAAWYISKSMPGCTIEIIEAKSRAGGWIQTQHDKTFSFELGPRMFKASKSQALLDLIYELKLEDQIQISKKALDRYVFWDNKLNRLPKGLLGFLFDPFTRDLIPSLALEWFRKVSDQYDESVGSFIKRRFGSKVLTKLLDPITQGIYASDPNEISVRSCFGSLKSLEQISGSITKGLLSKKKQNKKTLSIPQSSLFSLKGGIYSLVKQLEEKTLCKITYGEKALSIKAHPSCVEVKTDQRIRYADHVFVALSSSQAASLFKDDAGEVSSSLSLIPSVSITSVLIGFNGNLLGLDGFGYLVPSAENLKLLGCVFDSKIFDQNLNSTKLTLMFKGDLDDEQVTTLTHQALQNHLGILKTPDYLQIHRSTDAIPKFLVGHSEVVATALNKLRKAIPHCSLIGNYIEGVSVSDCVALSKKQTEKWMRKQGVLVK